MTNYKKQGKQNKAAGGRFELKVRHDLEKQGWVVAKWPNNVEFERKSITSDYETHLETFAKIIPAKRKYNPFSKALSIGTGFPDFVAFKKLLEAVHNKKFEDFYEVIGVEVKSNGYLKPEERQKCDWLIKNNIFSKILIAKKGQKRGEIQYLEYK